MTEQQKIERIAEGVMGCVSRYNCNGLTDDEWYDWVYPDGAIMGHHEGIGVIIDRLWNPFHSWDDAGMVLEKMREMPNHIRERFNKYILHKTLYLPSNLTPAIISEAALATLEKK